MAEQTRFWEKGQSFVEMAFGMVVLILLLGGLFDIGRAFLILVAVENATGEGALYGATHPECLMLDRADDLCPDNSTESVKGRVREEGTPIINLGISDITLFVDDIENGQNVGAGSVLRVDVRYQYSPVTPFGFLLWGSTAEVTATARQQILSPPPPGYQY